jgi:hypothetical protein
MFNETEIKHNLDLYYNVNMLGVLEELAVIDLLEKKC